MSPLVGAVRGNRWRILLAACVAGLVLYAFLQLHIDLGQSLSLLRKTNVPDYLAAIGVFYAASLVRAARWKLLLRNAGERAALATAWRLQMVGWFLNGLVPAKPGDLYRARALDRAYRTSTSKALGTIAMERLLDAGVLLLLIDALGLLLFRHRMPPVFAVALLASGVILATGLLLLTVFRSVRPRGIRLPARISPFAQRFQAGLIGSVSNIPLLLAITTCLWLMEGVRLYLVVRALPIPILSWIQLTFVALAGSLLTAFPGLPGGLSLVEGGMVAVLVSFGLTVSVGLTVALLDRLINYWSVLLLSLLAISVAAIIHLLHADNGRLAFAPWAHEPYRVARLAIEQRAAQWRSHRKQSPAHVALGGADDLVA
jgi:uncharacterized protein (TIRG00374 family)